MIDGLKDQHRHAILEVLVANDRVERAVLFGSRATETFTTGSDVDIALFGAELTVTDHARLAAALEELTVPQQVDLLLYDKVANDVLREHIRRHGIEWYRRRKAQPDARLDLPPKHQAVLEALLKHHLPGVEVWAYGSRAGGRSHDGSDLDLVLRGPDLKEIPIGQLEEFEEAVRESTLPFLVETRDWARLPELFQREIERGYVVIVPQPLERANVDWHETRWGDIATLEYGRALRGYDTAKGSFRVFGTNGSIGWHELDDKIELNRRMNATLEAMARAIFKDWFVDFGPTRAKAKGRALYLAPELWDLFPDALDNEGRPVGWEVRKLEDFLELVYGKSLPAKKRKLGNVAVYGSGGLAGTHDTALVKGPAVIVGRKGTVGSLYWEDGPAFPIDTVFYVVPRIGSILFSYHLLASHPLRDMNTDAAVPGLNRGNVYRLEFPLPTSELISAFEDVAGALWKCRTKTLKETETITQIRDLLLPTLMSGEIRLGEAKKVVEAMA